MSPKPATTPSGLIDVIEFVGLPGSGKSTIAGCLEGELRSRGLEVVSRSHVLADGAPFLLRHHRRSWVIMRNGWQCRKLYSKSFNQVRQSSQRSLKDLAKVTWNLWTVIAMIAEGRRRNGAVIIADQGLLQAIWSVQLSASRPFSPDLWKDVLLSAGIRNALVVNIHSEIEIAHMRASTRNSNGSRLTDRTWKDTANQWKVAAEIVAALMDLAEEVVGRGEHIIRVDNNTSPPEAAAAKIVSAIFKSRLRTECFNNIASESRLRRAETGSS